MAYNRVMEWNTAIKVSILKARESEYGRKLGGKIKYRILECTYNCNCDKCAYMYLKRSKDFPGGLEVKDLALSLLWLGSDPLGVGSGTWHRKFCMPGAWQKKKKKKKNFCAKLVRLWEIISLTFFPFSFFIV